MVSLELEQDTPDIKTAGKIGKTHVVKVRKDKKSDIVKLCLDGYEFASLGDLPPYLNVNTGKRVAISPDEPGDEFVKIDSVNFERNDRAKAGNWLIASMPSNFTIARVNGNVYGTILGGAYYAGSSGFYTAGTRPPAATTQWLSFQIKPIGLNAVGEHVAVSMMNYPYTSVPAIVGNGFIIGNNQGYPVSPPSQGGCGGAAAASVPTFNSQIESYWLQGNAVFADTCASTAVPENVFTAFTAHVNVYQDIAYWRNGNFVASKNTSVVRPYWHGAPLGTRPEATLDAGGILIGVTIGLGYAGNFSVQFQSLSSGWF